MLPPPPIQMLSQVVDVPSATTPSQVQSLREELTSLSLQASTQLAPLPPQSLDDQVFCPVVPTPTPVSSPTTEEPYMGSWAETADREAHLPPQEIPPTDQLPSLHLRRKRSHLGLLLPKRSHLSTKTFHPPPLRRGPNVARRPPSAPPPWSRSPR